MSSAPARRRVLGAACLGLAIAAAAVARSQQPAPAAPGQNSDPHLGNGFMLGKVIDSSTGQPVPGATVEIGYLGPVTNAYQTNAPNFVGVPPPVPRRVLTDDQGHFFFHQLGGGRYLATVSAPGYAGGGYLQTKPGGLIHYIDLEEDAARMEIVIRLWKYGAISGTVLDEHGEPIVGASVHVIARTMSGGLPRFAGNYRATTDDRGIYRVGSLRPDDYIVGITTVASTMPAETVEAYAAGLRSGNGAPQELTAALAGSGSAMPMAAGIRVGGLVFEADAAKTGATIPEPGADGRIQAYATTFYPNAAAAAQAAPIALHPGEERTGIDLSMRLMPTARVSGTVSGPSGPAGNMAVTLLPVGPIEDGVETTAEVATTATDRSGAFSLLGVPPGEYRLKVLKSDLAAAQAARMFAVGAPMPAQPATADPLLWAELPVQVSDHDVTGLAVALRNGLHVRGHVEFEGQKTKPEPDELSRMTITLTPAGPRPAVPFLPGRAAPDGTFATGDYPPGRYFVSANMPGWVLARVTRGLTNVADLPLEIDDRDIADATIVFTDQAAIIDGHVTDGASADTTADVIVFPADTDAWRQSPFSTRRYRLAGTTKFGDYEFAGLPAGEYFIVAVKNDQSDNWQDPKFMEKLAAAATRTTVRGGDKIQLDLKTAPVKR